VPERHGTSILQHAYRQRAWQRNAEESMAGAVSALADVAPVADVARIASTAHAVADTAPPVS
jgi:hypothetical protein